MTVDPANVLAVEWMIPKSPRTLRATASENMTGVPGDFPDDTLFDDQDLDWL